MRISHNLIKELIRIAVELPTDSEPIDQHTEARGPWHSGYGHDDVAADGQSGEDLLQLLFIVHYKTDPYLIPFH